MSLAPGEMRDSDRVQASPLPLFKSIRPIHFLSFDPWTPAIDLGRLNVLVGPNGSGKSNLIEAIAFVRACPVSSNGRGDYGLQSVVRRGGGVDEWIWKGTSSIAAALALEVHWPEGKASLHHVLEFASEQQRFHLLDEYIEKIDSTATSPKPAYYYNYQHGNPVISVVGDWEGRSLKSETLEADTSILAQRIDPMLYPAITYLANQYKQIAIYREWSFGRNSPVRDAQRTDVRIDRLEEDFSNLGLFLNRLSGIPKVKRELLDRLRDIYDGVDDFHINIFANTVQIFFNEGGFQIPSTRLSDGTLRYLCLLAILLDPTPPPLICIEEPELGLHPDILPKIADLLVAASARTQLIVTTHSDIIVDSMTDYPEAMLIVEKVKGATTIKHLAQAKPRERLGTMWMSGELGGTRW